MALRKEIKGYHWKYTEVETYLFYYRCLYTDVVLVIICDKVCPKIRTVDQHSSCTIGESLSNDLFILFTYVFNHLNLGSAVTGNNETLTQTKILKDRPIDLHSLRVTYNCYYTGFSN